LHAFFGKINTIVKIERQISLTKSQKLILTFVLDLKNYQDFIQEKHIFCLAGKL